MAPELPEPQPELQIDPETAFFILLRAREFHAKEEEVDPDEGSNPSDDRAIDVLEFQSGDSVRAELAGALDGLNEDERLDLIALAWLGRGDVTLDDWRLARRDARRIAPGQLLDYILGHPTISDDLQEGLAQFGLSLEAFMDGSALG